MEPLKPQWLLLCPAELQLWARGLLHPPALRDAPGVPAGAFRPPAVEEDLEEF